jgi:predicted Zn-ribbon and HTH transcriptional regulator
MDIYQLAQSLGQSEKEVMSHLPHVALSVAAHGGRFEVQAAKCRDCGYLYKDRRRLQPPGRCPRCRQSRIDGPWYRVIY